MSPIVYIEENSFAGGSKTRRFGTVLSDRIRDLTESVIRRTSVLAVECGAVNLSQGFPDFDSPEALNRAAIEAIETGHNQYSNTWGYAEFRKAIADKLHRFNGINADPEENIIVTCGATEAMIASLLATVNPGEEIVLFEPYYENFWAQLQVTGAILKVVTLHEPDFTLDKEALRQVLSRKTKVIVVNTPHNPTGRVFTMDELEAIADICREFDVLVFSDETYEHIIYDDHKHISIATLDGMADRTVTLTGLGKTYSTTGWRVGYAVGPRAIIDGVKKVHDFLTIAAPSPFQQAGVRALSLPESYYQELRESYDRKRKTLLKALEDCGFRCYNPEGAYYIMTNISAFSFEDDIAFSEFLIRDIGVAPTPGSCFYFNKKLGKDKVRFTFSKQDRTLREAEKRLIKLREAQMHKR